jgi:hypothetical protein
MHCGFPAKHANSLDGQLLHCGLAPGVLVMAISFVVVVSVVIVVESATFAWRDVTSKQVTAVSD